jgi:hypothetical protein
MSKKKNPFIEADELRTRIEKTNCCTAPDVDVPGLYCGHPLPCPRHTTKVAVMIKELQTQYEYVNFIKLEMKMPRKTDVWCCRTNSYGILGKVKWYATWRQYCFFPEANTVFNRGCMEDIGDFIRQLMEARKK